MWYTENYKQELVSTCKLGIREKREGVCKITTVLHKERKKTDT